MTLSVAQILDSSALLAVNYNVPEASHDNALPTPSHEVSIKSRPQGETPTSNVIKHP